jgi:hypothetical protein
VQVGTVAGTYLVAASGTIKCTYASGTTTYRTFGTGLTPPSSYPFNEPIYQQYTCQQILQVPGVMPGVTDA